jgi:2-polyprenyl-6-methoxyphenol hydroxylase-like FAD-dependent oxidoreductase
LADQLSQESSLDEAERENIMQQQVSASAKEHPVHTIKQVQQTTCCIVGGGPAGAVLALLLARKGIAVTLLEAHMDFERDFRGDTVHPSTMEIMDQLGLAGRLLQLPHTEVDQFVLQGNNSSLPVASLRHLPTKFPFVAVIAQSKFLDFITNEAKHYPSFQLIMGAQVDELIEENGTVRGVRYRGQDGWYEVRAVLTVGADGRFSRLRKLAGFEPIKTSPPMDILWFRLSRKASDPIQGLGARVTQGSLVALIKRTDYWQAGLIIPKGGYQELRAQGLEQLRLKLARAVPELADRMDELKEWKQISVLAVESSRLPRWYRPGLLLIGDAAHVMSPIGGVGINYAIQDAVAAANRLASKLQYGIVNTRDLEAIQKERELPTRTIQAWQTYIQRFVLVRALQANTPFKVPLLARLLPRLPLIRTLPARLIAFGLRPVRVDEHLL